MEAKRISLKNCIKWLYIFSIICLFLATFSFKFFFSIPSPVFFVPPIILWFIYSFHEIVRVTTEQLIEIIILAIIIFLQVVSNSGEGLAGQFLLFVIICGLIITPSDFKKDVLKAIIIVYTAICVISLIGWVAVFILKISIPYTYVHYQGYWFYDYGIFNVRVEGIEFTRYLGMFIEPGYTGVMTVFLFIANGSDIKKKTNILLLICALATLSFATYILLLLWFLLIKKSTKLLFRFAGGAIVGAVILLIIHFTIYDLTWVFEYFITRRIGNLFTEGASGSRYSDAFENYFNSVVLGDFSNILIGVGSVQYLEDAVRYVFSSAGIKVYIAEFGLINTVMVFLFYFYEIVKERSYGRMAVFVIWVLSFIDIAYPTWGCFLIFVVCFDSYMNYMNNKKFLEGCYTT